MSGLCRASERWCGRSPLFILKVVWQGWRYSHGVCAVCCMYRDECVPFCGECSVLAWCFWLVFFLLAPLVYRLEVCLNLCTCWGVSPVWKLNAWDANWRYHRPASKWMFKTKKNLGRKEGGWERERGKSVSVHCGGWTPLFNSFRTL